MTRDEAMMAVGFLAGGIPGFGEDALAIFTRAFEHEDFPGAMAEVCERLARTWEPGPSGAFIPSLREVLDEYRRHPLVVAEREASVAAALARRGTSEHCNGNRWVSTPDGQKPCPRCNPVLAEIFKTPDRWERFSGGIQTHELTDMVTFTDRKGMKVEGGLPPACKTDTRYDPERIPGFADGMAIARDEYRSVYGREIGDSVVANPQYAIDIIERDGLYDPENGVWYSTFTQVLDGFRGDYKRTIASLHGVGPRRLAWDNRGRLMLRPAPPAPESPGQTPLAGGPGEAAGPPDAPMDVGGFADALRATRQRIEGGS
jgi:hypothetical protein